MSELPLPADCDPRLRRLYDHWLSLRPAAGGLPGRQHIDPAAIRDLLPWIWMVDVERNPLRFRYRLLGTEQVHAMERDFTGRFLDEAHPSFVASVSYPQYVAAAERAEIGYRRGPPVFHLTTNLPSACPSRLPHRSGDHGTRRAAQQPVPPPVIPVTSTARRPVPYRAPEDSGRSASALSSGRR